MARENLFRRTIRMDIKIDGTVISVVKGDITEEETDAIVNAANSGLRGGGGVDGAIHRAGGPAIMAECRKIGGCPTGKAVITTGGNLKARFVIHAVGPVYRDGSHKEAALLQSAFAESLKIAQDKGLRSVSFPAISTGAYGFPMSEAARIALQTVADFVKKHSGLELVRFVLFGKEAFEVFSQELKRII